MMGLKKSVLGRGLDSLITMDTVQTSGSGNINEISIDKIERNEGQPRTSFDEDALDELAASIRKYGIIQPLTLRHMGEDTYQIISGERRWRAAKIAGLRSVPAYVRTASDLEMTEMALIENIQREDLNAMEVALTFQKLIDQFGITHDDLGERVGKSRASVANYLRLLQLPADIQLGLRDRRISMGQARAILTVENPVYQLRLYQDIIEKDLNVRQVEALAKHYQQTLQEQETERKAIVDEDEDARRKQAFSSLSDVLSDTFHTHVKLNCSAKGNGKITFSFRDEKELERLIGMFDKLKSIE